MAGLGISCEQRRTRLWQLVAGRGPFSVICWTRPRAVTGEAATVIAMKEGVVVEGVETRPGRHDGRNHWEIEEGVYWPSTTRADPNEEVIRARGNRSSVLVMSGGTPQRGSDDDQDGTAPTLGRGAQVFSDLSTCCGTAPGYIPTYGGRESTSSTRVSTTAHWFGQYRAAGVSFAKTLKHRALLTRRGRAGG